MSSNDNLKKVEAIQKLAKYLNKPLKEDQVRHYVKRLQGMPHGFVIRFCEDHMNETPPGMPSKFPSINHIEKRYREVGLPSDTSMTSHPRTDCDECMGEGLLWWLVDTGTGKIEYFAKCGDCHNWRRHILPPDTPTKYRRDLEHEGYTIFPYTRRRS